MRVILCLLVIATAALAFAQPSTAPSDKTPFRVKAGWADLGDFGGNFTAAVDYILPEWLFTAGWADVTDVAMTNGTDAFTFSGNYWSLEADYTYRPAHNQRMYVGGGLGWYDMQGHFVRPAQLTASSSDGSFGANAVLGFESDNQNFFGELRWVFGTSHFDSFDSDGLRAYGGWRF
jgi:hypothetical protein